MFARALPSRLRARVVAILRRVCRALWRSRGRASMAATRLRAGFLVLLVPGGGTLAETAADWDRLATPQIGHLGRKDHLPQGTVDAITRDADGFIWFGTEDGLARWDGYTARVFRHVDGDPGSLPDTLVKSLLLDRTGTLWILTPDGAVSRYERATESFTSFRPDATGPGAPIGFATDGGGGLWVDGKEGLAHLDPATGTWQREAVDRTGLPARYNRGLARSRDGSLYLARGERIGRLRGTRFDLIDLPRDPAEAADTAWIVSAIAEAQDGTIWYGTYGGRIGRLDPATGTARLVEAAAVPDSAVFSIAELGDGGLCFGYAGGGVLVYRPETGTATHLTAANGLSGDDVRAVATDPSGVLFIGSGHGVDLYGPSGRTVATLLAGPPGSPALSDPDVVRILPRPDGTVWFGLSHHGIDVFRAATGRIRTIAMPPAGPNAAGHNELYALAPDADGSVLASTTAGLLRVDPAGTVIRRLDGSPQGGLALSLGPAGRFVGTDETGVERIDPNGKRIALYAHDPADPASLRGMTAKALLDSLDGRIWVGTSAGLELLDPATGKVRHFEHDDHDPASLPAADVWTLMKDSRGRLWAGTGGNGIGVLDRFTAQGPARFHHIGRAQGLPHDNIDSLVEDAAGRIWTGTDDGLAVIDGTTLKVLRVLRPVDGQVVTNYWEGAATALPDGTLMFGGQGGVSVVHPERLSNWTYQPPVRVTEIKVDGRHWPAAAPVVLTPKQARVEVEFAALDYSAPDDNRYAYRLDGYDRDWVGSTATRRVAIYQNLPPGTYRLELRGSNREGLWVDPVSLPITVLPAWYQTLWFRTAEVLAGSALLFAVVQLRTRALRRRRVQLEREVALRTQELAVSAETLRLANAELKRLAHQDPLTGLGNRRRFFEMAEELLALSRRHDRPCSVMMVDLDHFKRVNDRYGHAGGDAALKAAARCLAGSVREVDIVARFGGEELAALLPETDLAAACLVAERFRQALESVVVRHEETEIRITASIGVASWARSELSIEPALERADAALYRVKEAGRNAVAAEPSAGSDRVAAGAEPG